MKKKEEDNYIIIKGARVNNLKNIDVSIPRNKLVVITGLSGSGKSSLAFDTLYAEGQRRYVESLSSYARQFMGRMSKPEVDYIHGVAPAIAIEQKVNTSNPRSTVGTSTEIYEYLKLLFARIGRTYSPISGVEVKRHSVSDVVDYIYSLEEGRKVMLLSPLVATEKRPLRAQLEILHQEGFMRVSIVGTVVKIEDVLAGGVDLSAQEEVYLLVDRITLRHGDDDQMARVSESVQTAFFEGRGACRVMVMPNDDEKAAAGHTEASQPREAEPRIADFSNRFEADGMTFEKPNPNFFSFNNPYGACPRCQGYGSVIGIDEDIVVPNKQLSVYEDAVVCWKGEKMSEWKSHFIRYASHVDFPVHTPYCELTEKERDLLWHGSSYSGARRGDAAPSTGSSSVWPGIDGFFEWVESQSYKIQYRVMLARYRGKTTCPDCHGSRLRKDAQYVKVCGRSISELADMPVSELAEFLYDISRDCGMENSGMENSGMENNGTQAATTANREKANREKSNRTTGLAPMTEYERKLTERIMKELHNRVGYLMDVGLGYLTLSRLSNSLSGGESQRINLATSLGSSLVGSMYILDEPSIGLHSRDTDQLIGVLKRLRDLGNTVIVVEHDEDIIRAADYIIDIGPGAGRLGGEVVFEGNFEKVKSENLKDNSEDCSTDVPKGRKQNNSLTVQYLLGMRSIEVPKSRRPWRDRIELRGVYCNNLKRIDVDIPLGIFTVVTGVSGSGKTSLVRHVLYDVLQKRFDGSDAYVGKCRSVGGDINRISGVEMVDQNPIGRSTRSNPTTYMKAYDEIRQLYAMQPLSKSRGYKAGYFSFNVEGGRCETCQGEGYVTIGMQFMADVHLVCEECHGTRFQSDTLEVVYHGKNVSEVLDMTVDQAVDFFNPKDAEDAFKPVCRQIENRLQPLQDVGLGYLKLGQSSSSLSGGEAQRIKLASFLVRGASEKPRLFIFDEPSTGLHFHDIQKLLKSFSTLVANGHSIVVIEHHPDIIKQADWIIDMGPEGGKEGGNVVFAGTPENLLKCKESYTAKFLKPKLGKEK